MKLFINKFFRFLFIVIGYITIITIINLLLLYNSNVFDLSSNVNILILGDSHSKYAFNDHILDNMCNLSNDADSYFYSYAKLRKIVEKNKQIDTLLLSFSSHNINKSIESRWLFNSSHLKSRLPIYLPVLNINEILFLAFNKPIEVFKGLFAQFQFPFFLLVKGKSIYGGYNDLGHNILKELKEKTLKTKNIKKNNNEKFLEASNEIKYLIKIKTLCLRKNIKLILVNPPLYNHKNIDKNLYLVYKKYFSDTPFIDYSSVELNDNCFGDFVHLSPCGAKLFSTLIKKKGLLYIKGVRTHNIGYTPCRN